MSKPPEQKPWIKKLEYSRIKSLPLQEMPKAHAIVGHETDLIVDQNCFAVNFGWPEQLTVPFITMSLDLDQQIDEEVFRSTVPSGCFIVLVGGKFISRLDDVVWKVEQVSKKFAITPSVYFGEKVDLTPNVNLENLPAMVHNKNFII